MKLRVVSTRRHFLRVPKDLKFLKTLLSLSYYTSLDSSGLDFYDNSYQIGASFKFFICSCLLKCLDTPSKKSADTQFQESHPRNWVQLSHKVHVLKACENFGSFWNLPNFL